MHPTTGQRAERIALAILDGFLGITAAVGGVCLLLRVSFVTPPADLLDGSPFTSYTIPGLALLALVGGGGLLATILTARRSPWGTLASALAGVMIIIFEAVELVVIGFTGLLAFYMLLGVAILAVAAHLFALDQPLPLPGRHSPQPSH
jgi:peptidoglycan/LPS O-acetylase OafA/YrhL